MVIIFDVGEKLCTVIGENKSKYWLKQQNWAYTVYATDEIENDLIQYLSVHLFLSQQLVGKQF